MIELDAYAQGEIVNIAVDADEMRSDLALLTQGARLDFGSLHERRLIDIPMSLLAQKVFRVLNGPSADPALMADAMLGLVTQRLCRVGGLIPQTEPKTRDQLDPAKLSEALDLIHDSIDSVQSVPALAQQVGLSRAHFTRAFRNTIGFSPHAYALRLRVEIGRRAIADGSSIAAAALQVGFFDQSHFTNCFRRTFGITPARFLRESRR